MTVKEAINKRYSSRYYEPNMPIDSKIMDDILEAGCLAPNGLGFEPWKFIVIEGDLTKLAAATNNQPHIQEASFVVALVNYKQELVEKHPEVFTDRLTKMGVSEEQQVRYMEYSKILGTQYYREQLMFAAAQMCLQATEHGVGSVIVGGYSKAQMAEILEIDPYFYEVGLLIDFGIPRESQSSKRIHREKSEVISKINL